MTESIIPQDNTRQISDKPEAPRIIPMPGGFELRWSFTDLDISAYVTRITDKATAEVAFYYATVEQIRDHKETILLSPNRVDFLSPNQKYNLVKQLQDIGYSDEFVAFCDWERKVNNIALAVMNTCRENIPAIEVRVNPDITLKPDYVVEPILYKDLSNIIFGDYASLKSLTSMVLAYIAQLPYTDNGLGLEPAGKETPTPCLWLDYEGQNANFQKQWTGIQKGFISDLEVPILYKEMTVPLADAIASVREDMADNNIKMIIVDSLGPAAGGNLNDPEPAIRYHQALRTLGGTSLTLAHNAKDLNSDSKSIFGSVFFSNLARSIWQCKAEKEPMSSYAIVGLKQIKASLSQIHTPIGLAFEFDEQANIIFVTKSDLKDTSLAGDLPLSLRIKDLLRAGAMTVNEIAEALDAKENTLRTALHRLKKQGVTVQLEDKWALRAV
jgi:hypothetical protein